MQVKIEKNHHTFKAKLALPEFQWHQIPNFICGHFFHWIDQVCLHTPSKLTESLTWVSVWFVIVTKTEAYLKQSSLKLPEIQFNYIPIGTEYLKYEIIWNVPYITKPFQSEEISSEVIFLNAQ